MDGHRHAPTDPPAEVTPTMFYRVSESSRRQARLPHELAVVNLLLFNLLLLIALLAGSFLPSDSPLADYRWAGILLPWLMALAMIAYGFVRGRALAHRGPWFVAAHWRLANARYKALLGTYLAGAALIGLGRLASMGYADPRMQDLMFVALERVAVAPLLIVLMVLVVLESGSLYQAGRGEVPDGLVGRFPPPPGLVPQTGEQA